jgi:hypothetical protein
MQDSHIFMHTDYHFLQKAIGEFSEQNSESKVNSCRVTTHEIRGEYQNSPFVYNYKSKTSSNIPLPFLIIFFHHQNNKVSAISRYFIPTSFDTIISCNRNLRAVPPRLQTVQPRTLHTLQLHLHLCMHPHQDDLAWLSRAQKHFELHHHWCVS